MRNGDDLLSAGGGGCRRQEQVHPDIGPAPGPARRRNRTVEEAEAAEIEPHVGEQVFGMDAADAQHSSDQQQLWLIGVASGHGSLWPLALVQRPSTTLCILPLRAIAGPCASTGDLAGATLTPTLTEASTLVACGSLDLKHSRQQ